MNADVLQEQVRKKGLEKKKKLENLTTMELGLRGGIQ